ncbi:MAG: flagellar assembly regulator FliX [Hyphomicrobiales bacterium]|nr:MAG: flagellar assembly regulator FliX [Hyphomicrobiales bacterium]
MRVNGPIRPNNTSTAGAARRGGSGSSFSPITSEAKPQAQTVSSTAPLYGIEAILALQEVGSSTEGKRRAIKRGHSLLDILEEMKIGLIDGTLSDALLDRLVTMLQNHEPSGDSEIDAVVAEIELRASVELAKRGRTLP